MFVDFFVPDFFFSFYSNFGTKTNILKRNDQILDTLVETKLKF